MARVDSGLGWTCDESFLATTPGEYLGNDILGIGEQLVLHFKQDYTRMEDTDIPVICAFEMFLGAQSIFEQPYLITSIPPKIIGTDAMSSYFNAISYWSVQSIENHSITDWKSLEYPHKNAPKLLNYDYVIVNYQGIDWIFYDGEHRGIVSDTWPSKDYGPIRPDWQGALYPEFVWHSDVHSLEEKAIQLLNEAGVQVKPHYTLFFYNTENDTNPVKEYIVCGEPADLSGLQYEDPEASTHPERDRSLAGWNTSPNATALTYSVSDKPVDIAGDGETVKLYSVWWLSQANLLGDRSGKLYTVENGTRKQLSETSLTGELFGTKGFQSNPTFALISDLDKPTIYRWRYEEDADPPALTANVSAVPQVPQLVAFSNNILEKEIDYLVVAANDRVTFNVSFDDGATWKYYQNGTWITADEPGVGNTRRELQRLRSGDFAGVTQIKFRCWVQDQGEMQSVLFVYK